MSTSGWSLPARAKTRDFGLPPALPQPSSAFTSHIAKREGEYFSSRAGQN